MSRGYLILSQSTKKDNYTRLAYALALSIRNSQSTESNVALATTDVNLPDKYLEVFDHVIDIPWTDQAEYSKWKIENKCKSKARKSFICIPLITVLKQDTQ